MYHITLRRSHIHLAQEVYAVVEKEVITETCVDLWHEMRSVAALARDLLSTVFIESILASVRQTDQTRLGHYMTSCHR